MFYNDLPNSVKRKLDQSVFNVYCIHQGHSEEVRKSIMFRLNPSLRKGVHKSLYDNFKDKNKLTLIK